MQKLERARERLASALNIKTNLIKTIPSPLTGYGLLVDLSVECPKNMIYDMDGYEVLFMKRAFSL